MRVAFALLLLVFASISVSVAQSSQYRSAAGLNGGAAITLSANAADSDGSVTRVDYYRNGTWIGAGQSAPYTVTWAYNIAGTYAITAVATDNRGARTTSAAVTVTINPPVGPLAVIANGQEHNTGPNDTVSVIDTYTHTTLATLAVGVGAFGVAVDTLHNRAYVSQQSTQQVAVIDRRSSRWRGRSRSAMARWASP
jgi:YVTN family beta-propeller protein